MEDKGLHEDKDKEEAGLLLRKMSKNNINSP